MQKIKYIFAVSALTLALSGLFGCADITDVADMEAKLSEKFDLNTNAAASDEAQSTGSVTAEDYLLNAYGACTITKYDAANNANIEFSAEGNNLLLRIKFGDYQNIKETGVRIAYYTDDVLIPYINSDGLDIINGIETNAKIANPIVRVQMINSDGTDIYAADYTKDKLTQPVVTHKKRFADLNEFVNNNIKRNFVIAAGGQVGGTHSFDKTLTLDGGTLVVTYYCADQFSANELKALEALFNSRPSTFLGDIAKLYDEIERDVDAPSPAVKVVYKAKTDFSGADALIIERRYDRASVDRILGK